jgi:hypothetical protein
MGSGEMRGRGQGAEEQGGGGAEGRRGQGGRAKEE